MWVYVLMAVDPSCYGTVISPWASIPCCPLNRPLHGWWVFRLGLLVVPFGVQAWPLDTESLAPRRLGVGRDEGWCRGHLGSCPP